MKLLFTTFILIFNFFAIAQTGSAKLPADTMKNIEIFSKKDLTEKSDFSELKKNIKILLALDDEDPSRTAVMMLSESYNKNKALYDKALKSVETKKNKKQISEIKEILKNFFNKGN